MSVPPANGQPRRAWRLRARGTLSDPVWVNVGVRPSDGLVGIQVGDARPVLLNPADVEALRAILGAAGEQGRRDGAWQRQDGRSRTPKL